MKQIEHTNTLEGLWTLLGLLLRDDFEVVATVADDVSHREILNYTMLNHKYSITNILSAFAQEEEDRLFDRSEMNMFAETVTATKIVAMLLRDDFEVVATHADDVRHLHNYIFVC